MPEIKEVIIARAKRFFKETIVKSHIEGGLQRASKLSEYNIHPFLFKYLANFLEGNDNPESIAKALIYPRILGTSITTSFGMKTQQMISEIFTGMGSLVPGIDIEFIDAIDNRKKYCQLKSGPNTINKDDIKTIVDHFKGAKNLARTNSLDLRQDDLVVGILYGNRSDLNSHYLKIDEEYPIIIGSEFWYRLTGKQNFYSQLIEAIGEVAVEVNGKDQIEAAIKSLALEIANSGL
jgi:hypothetical protein